MRLSLCIRSSIYDKRCSRLPFKERISLYTKSAKFYDALYSFKDYTATSDKLHRLLQQLVPDAESLLDVACGTGKHLEYLRSYYHVEGLDLNPDLLSIARRRCPGVPFHQANMVDFRLDHECDVITCLFSSIGYVKTVENLERTVSNMARHLTPGGVVVVEPWFTPESYWTGTITANFVDDPDLKIAWMYTSKVEERVSVLDINYLVGTPAGIDHFDERHEIGLFTREEYLGAFRGAGLETSYDAEGLFGRGMYIGLNEEAKDATLGANA
jgi:ubiquinone/menaquinone biosynthesis C-methylase UbiE